MIRAARDIKPGAKMKNANGVVRSLLLIALGISLLAPTRSLAQNAEGGDNSGAVFAMTNGVDKNEIIAFRRNDDGTLQETRRFETDGRGSGGNVDPLRFPGISDTGEDRLALVRRKCGERGAFSVSR